LSNRTVTTAVSSGPRSRQPGSTRAPAPPATGRSTSSVPPTTTGCTIAQDVEQLTTLAVTRAVDRLDLTTAGRRELIVAPGSSSAAPLPRRRQSLSLYLYK
jgi:hypothetical protein